MVCSILVRIAADIVPCINTLLSSFTTAAPVPSLVESACSPERSIDVPAGKTPMRENTMVFEKLARLIAAAEL